ALQSDEKVIIGGSPFRMGYPDPGIARLNPDGTVDKTFVATFPWATPHYVQTVAVRADGKVMLQSPYGIARLNPNGSLDNTFRFNQDATYGLVGQPIALQADGKLIVATAFGAAASIYRVVRLDIDGAIDPFFREVRFDRSVHSLFVQKNGNVLVGGNFFIA